MFWLSLPQVKGSKKEICWRIVGSNTPPLSWQKSMMSGKKLTRLELFNVRTRPAFLQSPHSPSLIIKGRVESSACG
uniref:Phosphoenolpyruvate synthase n=1 Tax=Vibrio harveyi TaxID=669 RepID=E5G5P2_VIBHA|nr:phosphoenolpyruvate synthase [Vibrio harveyi]